MTITTRRAADHEATWYTGEGDHGGRVDDEFLPVKEFTKDGLYTLRANVPGVDPDKDITVLIDDNVLNVSVERHSEVHEDGHDVVRHATFSRTVRLPSVRADAGVKATYAGGVLTVSVPIGAQSHQPLRVPVTPSDDAVGV